MSSRVRFLIEDADGKGSTTGVVIEGSNVLNQMRQFAFDGRRYFYQKDNRAPFVEVNPRDIPHGNKERLDQKWIETRGF